MASGGAYDTKKTPVYRLCDHSDYGCNIWILYELHHPFHEPDECHK